MTTAAVRMLVAVQHRAEFLRVRLIGVREENVACLSPFVGHHISMLGRYSFQLPDLPGGLRLLRDPDAPEDE